MSPENVENISNIEGWGLALVAYKKQSVDEAKRNFLQVTTIKYKLKIPSLNKLFMFF